MCANDIFVTTVHRHLTRVHNRDITNFYQLIVSTAVYIAHP